MAASVKSEDIKMAGILVNNEVHTHTHRHTYIQSRISNRRKCISIYPTNKQQHNASDTCNTQHRLFSDADWNRKLKRMAKLHNAVKLQNFQMPIQNMITKVTTQRLG